MLFTAMDGGDRGDTQMQKRANIAGLEYPSSFCPRWIKVACEAIFSGLIKRVELSLPYIAKNYIISLSQSIFISLLWYWSGMSYINTQNNVQLTEPTRLCEVELLSVNIAKIVQKQRSWMANAKTKMQYWQLFFLGKFGLCGVELVGKSNAQDKH